MILCECEGGNCGVCGAAWNSMANGGGDREQMRLQRIAVHLQLPAVAAAAAGLMGSSLGMQTCSASDEREAKVVVPVPKEFQSKAWIKSRQQVRELHTPDSGCT